MEIEMSSQATKKPPIQTLDTFFSKWIRRHNVVATVEGGLEFEEAKRAWEAHRGLAQERVREVDFWKGIAIHRTEEIERLTSERDYHKAKADEWLTAYQRSRVKNIGDYTRYFIRRPKLRRFIQFLMRLG